MFHAFTGIDADVLSGITRRGRFLLSALCFLILLVLIVVAAAFGWAFWASGWSDVSAILVGIFSLCLLVAMQMFLTISAAPDSYQSVAQLEIRIAHPIRRWVYLFLALLVSQIVLTAIYSLKYPDDVLEIAEKSSQAEQLIQNMRKQVQLQEIQVRLIKVQEDLHRLERLVVHGEDSKEVFKAPVGGSSRRKAMIVIIRRYANDLGPLSGARETVVPLANALRSAGFQVSSLTDATLSGFEQAFQRYLNELQPGDISLFFFVGHAIVDRGVHYLIPTDFRSGQSESALSLPVLATSLSRQRLSSNLIWLDLSRPINIAPSVQAELVVSDLPPNSALVLSQPKSPVVTDAFRRTSGALGLSLARSLQKASAQTTFEETAHTVSTELSTLTQGSQLTTVTNRLTGSTHLVSPEAPLLQAKAVRFAGESVTSEKLNDLAKHWQCPSMEPAPFPEAVSKVRLCLRSKVAMLEDTLRLSQVCLSGDGNTEPEAQKTSREACVKSVLAAQFESGTQASTAHQQSDGPSPARAVDLHSALTFIRELWLERSLFTLGASLGIAVLLYVPFWLRDTDRAHLTAYETRRWRLSHDFLEQEFTRLEQHLTDQLAANHPSSPPQIQAWVQALMAPFKSHSRSLPVVELAPKGEAGIAVKVISDKET